MTSFRKAQLMFFNARLVQSAQTAIEIIEDIYDPPYGGREFGIRDLNGYSLYFLQERITRKRESMR